MNNFYLVDARTNFRRTAGLLGDLLDPDNCMDGIIYFAAGCERFFKGILWEVSPILTLEDERVDNAIKVLYQDRIVPGSPHTNIKDVNDHSLPYQASLLRAAKFSPTVNKHIGLFTKLAAIRNAIVHGNLADVDFDLAGRFIDVYFDMIAMEFASELHFSSKDAYGDRFEDKAPYDDTAMDSIKALGAAVEKRLEKHRQKWEEVKNDNTHLVGARVRTVSKYRSSIPDGFERIPFTCPACKQQALITIEEEQSGMSLSIGGFTIARLECEYCDLMVDAQLEMDYLRLYNWLDDPDYRFAELI